MIDELELARVASTGESLLLFVDSAGNYRQISLPAYSSTWSAIYPTGFVSQQAVATAQTSAGGIQLISYENATNQVLLREYSPGTPAASGTWPGIALGTGVCMTSKPALVEHPDVLPPFALRTTLFYRACTTQQTMRAQRVPTDPLNFTTPTVWGIVYNTDVSTGTGGYDAIYDTRPSPNGTGTEGVRLLGRRGVGCNEAQICGAAPCVPPAGGTVGKWCAPDGTLSGIFTWPALVPFPFGDDPAYYADYDDYKTFQWGYCEALARDQSHALPTPPGHTHLMPRSFVSENFTRCGPIPAYGEPIPGGGLLMIPPSADDRGDHPWLYEAADELSCP